MRFEDWNEGCTFGQWRVTSTDEGIYLQGHLLKNYEIWRLFEFLQDHSRYRLSLSTLTVVQDGHVLVAACCDKNGIVRIDSTQFDEYDRNNLLPWLMTQLPKEYKYRESYLRTLQGILAANLRLVEEALVSEETLYTHCYKDGA